METRELCKNIEGDPAKPDLAATTCWRPNNQRSVYISLTAGKVLMPFYPYSSNALHSHHELHCLGNQSDRLGILVAEMTGPNPTLQQVAKI